MKCPPHVEIVKSTGEITVGDEIATTQNIHCRHCGKFLRYNVISRRKKK